MCCLVCCVYAKLGFFVENGYTPCTLLDQTADFIDAFTKTFVFLNMNYHEFFMNSFQKISE